jgi:hypothetical protein
MKSALFKTLILVTAVAGIVSLAGCKEANSAPASTTAVSENANNADVKTPAAPEANARKAEAATEIY